MPQLFPEDPIQSTFLPCSLALRSTQLCFSFSNTPEITNWPACGTLCKTQRLSCYGNGKVKHTQVCGASNLSCIETWIALSNVLWNNKVTSTLNNMIFLYIKFNDFFSPSQLLVVGISTHCSVADFIFLFHSNVLIPWSEKSIQHPVQIPKLSLRF